MDRDVDRLNANVDYMASQLADMIRSCMRSSASSEGNSRTYQALEKFQLLLKLIGYSEGIKGYELFEKALEEFKYETDDEIDRAILRAAKTGMQYLIELSCSDPAAGGRASKRQYAFLDALKCIDHAREHHREKRRRPETP